MNKYLCVHGHFYQPPRENPWLNAIELQESAHPYHDWNERITAECYARNACARVMNSNNDITHIVNNYSKMSFNFGPTLLSWMEKFAPDAYANLLEADRMSQEQFSGHGSALAQVYNHMIMPLANTRDKRTQILWGIKDFEHRFKRFPEGMWLAETAVDLETLDLLAEAGIKFTILAPHQAKEVWPIGKPDQKQPLDTRRAYLCKLPSGRSISLFFYDGATSQSVAFDGLLNDGAYFAKKLTAGFDQNPEEAQLAHIATDGETYGHHHTFGEMALTYALECVKKDEIAQITIYGEFLEKFPPQYEVEIVGNSSWSCVHGVERWRDDCGCCTGLTDGHQKWREPLREALDWLRDQVAPLYEQEVKKYVDDPWQLRDDYIDVVLNRDVDHVSQFLRKHTKRDLLQDEESQLLQWLEAQHNAMLMFTSCGWFFDEISRIETTQILKYAARVIQLVKQLMHEEFELGFIERLGKAPSNLPEYDNGARVYKQSVDPAVVDLCRVGAHYAIVSLVKEHDEEAQLYDFTIQNDSTKLQESGRLKLFIGQGRIISNLTWEKAALSYVALHLGDHNFVAGVDQFRSEEEFNRMKQDLLNAFGQSDTALVIKSIQNYFGKKNYSLWQLFRDDQQNVLDEIFASTMDETEDVFRQLYEDHYPLIRRINQMKAPLPKALQNVVEFIFKRDLIQLLNEDPIDQTRLKRLVEEVSQWPFKRDKESLNLLASQRVCALMQQWFDDRSLEHLNQMIFVLEQLDILNLTIDVWQPQNLYFEILKTQEHQNLSQNSTEYQESFTKLGQILKIFTK